MLSVQVVSPLPAGQPTLTSGGPARSHHLPFPGLRTEVPTARLLSSRAALSTAGIRGLHAAGGL